MPPSVAVCGQTCGEVGGLVDVTTLAAKELRPAGDLVSGGADSQYGAGIRPFGRDQMRTAAWKLPMVFIDS